MMGLSEALMEIRLKPREMRPHVFCFCVFKNIGYEKVLTGFSLSSAVEASAVRLVVTDGGACIEELQV